MPRAKLTKANVDKLPHPAKGQILHWDTELPGFGLLIGATTKSYLVQKQVKGRTRRVTIGRHDGTWVPETARKEARRLLQEMDVGRDPVQEKKQEEEARITLRQARQKHDAKMRKQDRAQTSIDHYWWLTNKYLSDWLDKPLVELTEQAIERRHTDIGERHGRASANHAMRVLRAAWNVARLGPNPVNGITMYAERERRALIDVDDLPLFADALAQIENPIRADFYLLLILTGLRRTDAASIRWADVDLEKRYIHRPNPKGGERCAFNLPLSQPLIDLLQRRREHNEPFFCGSPYVFPAASRSGHLDEGKLSAKEGRSLPITWYPHMLRHTFITHAENEIGIPTSHVRALTNHTLPKPKDAHAGYVHLHFRHLAASQEKISSWFMAQLWPGESGDNVVPLKSAG